MRNHQNIAIERPEAYAGEVEMVGNRRKVPIVEAANSLDLPPLIQRFEQWAICASGLECLVTYYPIHKTRLYEEDWVDHVTAKRWVNRDDFVRAYEAAKDYFKVM